MLMLLKNEFDSAELSLVQVKKFDLAESSLV